MVDYVEAAPIGSPGDMHLEHAQIQTVLHEYWQWVGITKQPYYLSDISKDNAWGQSLGKLVLFDIEPLFSATGHPSTY